MQKALTRALVEEAEDLMADSKQVVPVDTGNLRDSGTVLPPKRGVGLMDVSVEAGYGGPAAPYALVVHENPRAGKTGGVTPSGSKRRFFAQTGGWKYLEQPFNQRVKGVEGRVAAIIKHILKI